MNDENGREETPVIRKLTHETESAGKRLPNGKELCKVVAEKIVKEALRGNYAFMRELIDRMEGVLNHSYER